MEINKAKLKSLKVRPETHKRVKLGSVVAGLCIADYTDKIVKLGQAAEKKEVVA